MGPTQEWTVIVGECTNVSAAVWRSDTSGRSRVVWRSPSLWQLAAWGAPTETLRPASQRFTAERTGTQASAGAHRLFRRDARLRTEPEDCSGLMGGRGRSWGREEEDETVSLDFNSSTTCLYALWRDTQVCVVSVNPPAGKSRESPFQTKTERRRESLNQTCTESWQEYTLVSADARIKRLKEAEEDRATWWADQRTVSAALMVWVYVFGLTRAEDGWCPGK